MKAPGSDYITGSLVSKWYESPTNMYKVLRVKTQKHKIITVVGNIDIDSGILYTFVGNWQENSKYGTQFRVLDYYPYKDFENTEENIVSYISSRLFEGIGSVKAKRIYEKFGEDTIHIVEDEPERLVCIQGITDRTVNLIKESFQRNVRYRLLTLTLKKEGISDSMIDKIYAKYEADSMNVVKETPYKMAYEIDGFGFKRADKIALAADSNKYNSEQRIQAGIYFALKTGCEKTGNLYLNFNELVEEAKNLLDTDKNKHITRKEIDRSLMNLCKDKKIILRDNGFYLAKYYYDERQSVMQIVDLMNSKSKYNFNISDIEKELLSIETQNKIKYSNSQKKAIINSLTNTVSIITGGPGTGKSTIINAIIEIFQKLSGDSLALIASCAPTGKAAKRMNEVTGRESYTIHRLLKVDGNTGKFIYNKDNPMPYSFYIIDEFSMVDISLFRNFISAVPKSNCKVIFVGDIDQLPSVGPGNVLRDLITSEYIKTVKLTDIFRQKNTSNIVINSHVINSGKGNLQCGDDFQVIPLKEDVNEKEIFDKILEVYKENLKKYDDIQVLTPYRSTKYMVSSGSLNCELSRIVNYTNQNKVVFTKGNTEFHVNDKVMQTKNNYKKMVFNGETGTIVKIEKEGSKKIAIVDYGDNRKAEYVSGEELEMAYATTIHKSQGSEYDCVIVPIIRSNTYFLDRSIAYTAITRAKKKCIIICHPQTLRIICNKINSVKRKTNMAEDIRKYRNNKELHDYANFSEADINKILANAKDEVY